LDAPEADFVPSGGSLLAQDHFAELPNPVYGGGALHGAASFLTGPSLATGAPCLVMVIASPASGQTCLGLVGADGFVLAKPSQKASPTEYELVYDQCKY